MSRLIFQYHSHPEVGYCDKSRLSLREYADFCGADFWFLDGACPYNNHFYGTFLPFFNEGSAPVAGFAEQYDEILYVDSDILWTGTRRNVFSDLLLTSFAAHQMNTGPVKTPELRRRMDRDNRGTYFDGPGHFNCGVVFYARPIYSKFREWLRRSLTRRVPPRKYGGHDQHHLNLYALENRDVTNLPEVYNYHLGRYPIQPPPGIEPVLMHYHGANKRFMI